MKRAFPLLLGCLLLPAAADGGSGPSLAEAKQLLVSKTFRAVDESQPSRPSFTFRIPAGAAWRLRPAAGAFVYAGPADDLLAPERIRVRFTLAGGAVTGLRGPRVPASQPALPLRAAFYYPWYPRNWGDGTIFHPSFGLYDSNDATAIRAHLEAMLYGNVDAGIYSWWGQGDRTDQIFPRHLAIARATPFRWALYYEPEGYGNPSVERLRRDLDHILARYGRDPAYLRVGGRPVLFAWGDDVDSCATPARWLAANRGRFYVVLKVFPGFQRCTSQPEGWHQYGPAFSDDAQPPWAYTISPGFHRAGGEPVRLERDLARWRSSIERMVSSRARFQLVTSYNEWTEGTSVESADEWASPSGFGAYLDALHEAP